MALMPNIKRQINKIGVRFFLVLLLFSFLGCSKVVSKQELLNYTLDSENGLLKKEEKSNSVVEVLYRPNDLMLLQEIKGRSFDFSQIDSVKKYFQGFSYFLLRLSRNGKEITIPYAANPVKFNQANDYLGFGIGKDVYLVQSRDTIKVQDFIHTRTFGSSPSSDVLFAFKTDLRKKSGQVRFIFNDQQFELGLNEFSFDISDIKSTPSIDLTHN